MESVTARIEANGTSLIEREIKLGLADDEMAQLEMIDIEVQLDVTASADEGLAVSLDPDSDINPLSDDIEDLEYICGLYAKSAATVVGSVGKTLLIDKPYYVGTNLGVTVKCTSTSESVYTVTIWFTRKKASDVELAKILLKRR